MPFPQADLKPLNVVLIGITWQLIDMDVSCEVGKAFGTKVPSSGHGPPEMAKVLIAATNDETGVVNTARLAEYSSASVAYDIWSLGVILSHLVTGRQLWLTDQNDNVGGDDLRKLAAWKPGDLRRELKRSTPNPSDDQKVAFHLLRKLLEADPSQRLQHFDQGSEMLSVLDHPFFKVSSLGGLGDADVKKILTNIEEQLNVIHDNVIDLITMGKALQAQLERTQSVLLVGIFEATEVSIPTSCIILPHKLGGAESAAEEIMNYFEEQEGAKEDEDEERGAPTSRLGVMKGWFNQAVSIGKTLKDGGELFDAGVEAAKLAVDMTNKSYYLYLIDEVTGKPVIPEEDGDDTYPIEITKPGEWVGKLMPFMKTGLKVMAVANGICSVAQCFFPGVPTIPASIRNKAKTAVGALDQESSVAEFNSLSVTLEGADGEGGKTKGGQRGAALREFERFLGEHDKDKTFGGLRRTVFQTGDKAGTAVWTLEEDEAVINAIAEASAAKMAAEEGTYKMLEDAEARINNANGGAVDESVAALRQQLAEKDTSLDELRKK